MSTDHVKIYSEKDGVDGAFEQKNSGKGPSALELSTKELNWLGITLITDCSLKAVFSPKTKLSRTIIQHIEDSLDVAKLFPLSLLSKSSPWEEIEAIEPPSSIYSRFIHLTSRSDREERDYSQSDLPASSPPVIQRYTTPDPTTPGSQSFTLTLRELSRIQNQDIDTPCPKRLHGSPFPTPRAQSRIKYQVFDKPIPFKLSTRRQQTPESPNHRRAARVQDQKRSPSNIVSSPIVGRGSPASSDNPLPSLPAGLVGSRPGTRTGTPSRAGTHVAASSPHSYASNPVQSSQTTDSTYIDIPSSQTGGESSSGADSDDEDKPEIPDVHAAAAACLKLIGNALKAASQRLTAKPE